MSSTSLPRQNFHQESEAGINRQINLELYAANVYLSMSNHFDRDDVALPGFSNFFKKLSDEEREDADQLIKYQNQRGGRVVFQAIPKPEKDDWGSGLNATETALTLEKNVNQSLLELHAVAERHGDVQMCDFLEGEFLKPQIDSIKQLADYSNVLKRLGPGIGEYMFDKETLS